MRHALGELLRMVGWLSKYLKPAGHKTLTVVRVQLVSALGSAHGILGFTHVASHVSVRVVLDEQLARLRVCKQKWYQYFFRYVILDIL